MDDITIVHKKLVFVIVATDPIRNCYWLQDPANKPTVTSIALMIHSEAL